MKHGSVIVKGGRVISTGMNKERNHPRILSSEHIKTDCSVHAEIDALKKVRNTNGAIIYIARVNKNGQARDSKPCSRCYSALRFNGIKKIVYTTSEE
jgi:deoxycytidylate deaminase